MPSPQIVSILLKIFVVLFAITVHEAAHAWIALKNGDPTAASLGRVSLNPLVHIDLFGTIILPAILIFFSIQSGGRTPVFGWAKPVPYNPYNLKNARKGALRISLAGPAANALTALAAAGIFQALRHAGVFVYDPQHPFTPVIGLFNLLVATVEINISLAFFNLIPIPPLDGSGILAGLLPPRAAIKFEQLRPYSFFLLLILITTRILDLIFVPALYLINWLLS
jgi:Zn-dependent protease